MKFSAGDVCVVILSAMPQFPVGSEVTVLEVRPDPRFPHHPYVIWRDGYDVVVAGDHNLRRKDPPEAGSWHEVFKLTGWCPSKIGMPV